MIFFENCRPFLWVGQYLSILRRLILWWRPSARWGFLLVFSCCFLVSVVASAAQVTLNLKSVSLDVAFAEIKKQTGYGFWYEKKDLLDLPKVSVSVRDVELRAALEACLKGQPLSYEIFDKTVVLKRTSAAPAVVPSKRSVQEKVRGKVVDVESKEPLAGVFVKVKSPEISVVTNDKGEFELSLAVGKYELLVQYLGYNIREFSVTVPTTELLFLELTANENKLNQVEIVNTGYQSLPKERGTGSFTTIDEKTISRAVSPDLLSRLNGVSNGLLFDSTVGNSTGISVRGRSTIFSNTTPLIVIDNFPFEGDLNTINPDVIESVTLLKDAAAASIWGVRAGNGVLVITTKKGKQNTNSKVALNVNTTIGNKPDLYYEPQLSSSQYIDVERFLFDKGAYNSTINNGFGAISPVVALLQKIKVDPSYSIEGNAKIDAFRDFDIRRQLEQYYYRNSSMQHYASEISGGGQNQSYHFFAGFDKNLQNAVWRSDDRVTLKGNNRYFLWKNRLKINTDISFSKSRSNNDNSNSYVPFLPYEQVADSDGNPLATVRRSGLSAAYVETAGNGRLLDWKYRPLEELFNKYSTLTNSLVDYRINLGLDFRVLKGLDLSINYQYYNASNRIEANHDKDSFYVRNMVNSFSAINSTNGEVSRPVPYGGIYSPSLSNRKSNYGRGQLNFFRNFGTQHEISAIAGYEIRDDNTSTNTYTVLGYSPETGNGSIVDLINLYPMFYNPASASRIVAYMNQGLTVNRYVSYYGNAAYSYSKKYTVSLSYRKDESNLFGVRANQKGVPLWSAGFAWNLHEENFLKEDWISSIQLKGSYGYNGNVNNSISAYLTSSAAFYNPYGILSYGIVNPPNDNLRWERVKNMNVGIHFSMFESRIGGSIELYKKQGRDLIATSPIAPQTGVSLFTGNTANTQTEGVDFQLNLALLDKSFRWSQLLIFNVVKDRITDYKVASGTNANIVTASTNSLSPLVGYPINSVFAYRWGGLNNLGNPLGYIDGNISNNYAGIYNSVDRSQLDFFGSATPTKFGSIRNTFAYKNIELSFNVVYKLGYFFRRSSLSNGSLYSGGYIQRDYEKRWQSPGDEINTNVPALVYPNITNRNDFYTYSGILIEKGDHIRLQDVQLNYSLSKNQTSKLPFSSLNVYLYANNLGLLWKANKEEMDPDVRTGFPNPRTLSFGLKTNF